MTVSSWLTHALWAITGSSWGHHPEVQQQHFFLRPIPFHFCLACYRRLYLTKSGVRELLWTRMASAPSQVLEEILALYITSHQALVHSRYVSPPPPPNRLLSSSWTNFQTLTNDIRWKGSQGCHHLNVKANPQTQQHFWSAGLLPVSKCIMNEWPNISQM